MSEDTGPPAIPALGYATPLPKGSRILPSVVLMVTGLGLVFLGGCFLIGVLIINRFLTFGPGPGPVPTVAADILLEFVLYVVAFASFAGAAILIIRGMKRLAAAP